MLALREINLFTLANQPRQERAGIFRNQEDAFVCVSVCAPLRLKAILHILEDTLTQIPIKQAEKSVDMGK